MIQVDGTLGTCSTATACYTYDAKGQRWNKTMGSIGADFLYDLEGHQVDSITSGAWNRSEVYADNRHFATYLSNPMTYFIYSDWLGTERFRTPYVPSTNETCTNLPFGDGMNCSGTDVSPMHFTGKERDSESNLDNFGARYDASSMGRFMSPDPLMASAKVWDPQTWNRYSYTLNNPLRFIDPTGMDEVTAAQCAQDKHCVTVNVNVIFDKNANDGKGLTDKQKAVLGLT